MNTGVAIIITAGIAISFYIGYRFGYPRGYSEGYFYAKGVRHEQRTD